MPPDRSLAAASGLFAVAAGAGATGLVSHRLLEIVVKLVGGRDRAARTRSPRAVRPADGARETSSSRGEAEAGHSRARSDRPGRGDRTRAHRRPAERPGPSRAPVHSPRRPAETEPARRRPGRRGPRPPRADGPRRASGRVAGRSKLQQEASRDVEDPPAGIEAQARAERQRARADRATGRAGAAAGSVHDRRRR